MGEGPGTARGQRARSLRQVLVGCVVVAIAAAALVGALRSGGSPSPGERLLRTAAGVEPPVRYRFEIVPDSVGLQACYAARRRVRGTVDLGLQRAGFEVEPIGLAAVVTDSAAYVHRSALPGWPIPTEWLDVSGPLDPEVAEALTTALGPDLAALVIAPGLPPPASAVAAAAVEALRSAEVLDPRPDDDPALRRVAVSIDAAALDPTVGRRGADGDDVPLRLVFSIGSAGQISEVSARLNPSPSATDDESFGYRTTYDASSPAAVPDLPDREETTPVQDVAVPARPQGPDVVCSVGP